MPISSQQEQLNTLNRNHLSRSLRYLGHVQKTETETESSIFSIFVSKEKLSKAIFINLNVARKNCLSPLFPSVTIATFWLETIVFENLIISLKRYNLIHYCKRESCLISCFLTAQTGRMAFIARVPEPLIHILKTLLNL